jgi:hypothetical protein
VKGKIIAENSPNLRKGAEAFRTSRRKEPEQKRTSPHHILVKILSEQKKASKKGVKSHTKTISSE